MRTVVAAAAVAAVHLRRSQPGMAEQEEQLFLCTPPTQQPCTEPAATVRPSPSQHPPAVVCLPAALLPPSLVVPPVHPLTCWHRRRRLLILSEDSLEERHSGCEAIRFGSWRSDRAKGKSAVCLCSTDPLEAAVWAVLLSSVRVQLSDRSAVQTDAAGEWAAKQRARPTAKTKQNKRKKKRTRRPIRISTDHSNQQLK